MVLKLNATREAYQEFYGRNIEQMPKLVADGRVPMNVAQLMQRKLDVRNSDAKVKSSYMDNYFDTSDLKAQRGNEVKLFLTTYADGSITPLGREYLAMINPEEELINRAVNLGVNDRYEKIQGNEVVVAQREKLAEVINTGLTEQQAKDSLFWRVILRHPDVVPKEFAIPGLHEEVIPYIFSEAKQRFKYDTNMGVYPGLCSKNVSEMRAWFVFRLERRSLALGWPALDYDSGRFVGIAPEALSTPGKGASNIKAYTIADLQAVDKVMEGLEGTLHPDVLKPFAELRKKL
ncbi:MAG: hypothetical protein ABIH37_00700 [archaeon]